MKTARFAMAVIVLIIVWCGCASAAPYRYTDEISDGSPVRQWFRDFVNPLPFSLNAEFYDNIASGIAPGQDWGSGPEGYKAIQGCVSNIFYDTFGDVAGFSISASVANDTYNFDGALVGTGCAWSPDIDGQVQGTLKDVRLTADFADDGVLWNSPGVQSNIYATNFDELAWRGSSTQTPPEPAPGVGNYCVPAWRLGDISFGASASRELRFALYSHAAPGTELYNLLHSSKLNQTDILSNRTNAPGIRECAGALYPDDGSTYPGPISNPSGNVSVFSALPPPPPSVRAAPLLPAPADVSWHPLQGTSRFNMLNFELTSNLSEYVGFSRLEFTSTGTMDSTGVILDVYCEIMYEGEQYYIQGRGVFADGKCVVQSNEYFTPYVQSNSSIGLSVYCTMPSAANAGETFNFQLTGVTAVTFGQGTPVRVRNLPLSSSTVNIEADPAHLSISPGDTPSLDRITWYPALGSNNIELAQFKAAAHSSNDILIDGFYLQSNNQCPLNNISIWFDNDRNGKIDPTDTLCGQAQIDNTTTEILVVPQQSLVLSAGSETQFILATSIPADVAVPPISEVQFYLYDIQNLQVDAGGPAVTVGLPIISSNLILAPGQPAVNVGNAVEPQIVNWRNMQADQSMVVSRIRVTGDPYEDTMLQGLTIKANCPRGASNTIADIEYVDIRVDVDKDGTIDDEDYVYASGYLNQDGELITTLPGIVMVPRESSADLLVVWRMKSPLAVGSTYYCSVKDVSVSGITTGLPAVVNGTPAQTGGLTVVEDLPHLALQKTDKTPASRAWWNGSGSDYVDMLAFKVTAKADESIVFQGIYISCGSNSDYNMSNIEGTELWLDNDGDGKVGSGDSLAGIGNSSYGALVGLMCDTPLIVAPHQSAYFVVRYKMKSIQDPMDPPCIYYFHVTEAYAYWEASQLNALTHGCPFRSAQLSIIYEPSAASISETKKLPPYSYYVKLDDVVVTAAWDNNGLGFVQDPKVPIGMQVNYLNGCQVGDHLSLVGRIPFDDEGYGYTRSVSAIGIEKLSSGNPAKPLMMTNKATGGAPFGYEPGVVDYYSSDFTRYATGLNTVGTLVKTTGRIVTDPQTSGGHAFYIDDGSGVQSGATDADGNPIPGILVRLPVSTWSLPSKGAVVSVTGILAAEKRTDDIYVRVLLPRTRDDIQPY